MASTNSTANLELSQFVGTDKPDWLTDYNGDMLKIDGAYGAVSATAEEAAANAESAATSASQAAADAAEALSGISGAIDAAAAAQAAAEQATSVSTSALSVANGAANTAQSAAGDATQALSVAQNAKVTAENAQAAAAQSATDAAASATSAAASAATVAQYAEIVPESASSSNKLATMADIGSGAEILLDMDYNTLDGIMHYEGTPNWNTVLADMYAQIPAELITKYKQTNTNLELIVTGGTGQKIHYWREQNFHFSAMVTNEPSGSSPNSYGFRVIAFSDNASSTGVQYYIMSVATASGDVTTTNKRATAVDENLRFTIIGRE